MLKSKGSYPLDASWKITGNLIKGIEMKEFVKELSQALLMATLIGGPIFFYFLFMMKA